MGVYDNLASLALAHHSEHDILDQYRPRPPASQFLTNDSTQSRQTSVSGQDLPQHSIYTFPTSNGIHVQHRAENRREGSLGTFSEEEEGSFLWGIGQTFGDAVDVLPPSPTKIESDSTTFMKTYFETLPHMSKRRRVTLSIVGIMFLLSTIIMGHTFRQVHKLELRPRIAQLRLLVNMIVWCILAGADGILRFRPREKIAVSMLTVGILTFVLSHFVQFMADLD